MTEKTHDPTPKKRRDARAEGQVARSRLLASACVTLGGLSGAMASAEASWRRLCGLTRALLTHQETPALEALNGAIGVLARASAPVMGGATLAALASSVAMAGLQFNPSIVSPRLERLDALKGLTRLLSGRQLVDVLKGLAVAALVWALLWRELVDAWRGALPMAHTDGARALVAALATLAPALLRASIALVALGLGDWALMRRRHLADLMMSHQEVKQEHKTAEGDPHQKSKRRALHKQLAAGGSVRGVRAATAVVVNPTHLAIGLRYAEDECDAPYIVARGREEDALTLRREAEALGIPVVRDIPLARSLIHYDVGEEVPEELYQAAAAILAAALEAQEARR